jgi:hypothetical protein
MKAAALKFCLLNNMKEEVLQEVNACFILILHGPHRKRKICMWTRRRIDTQTAGGLDL